MNRDNERQSAIILSVIGIIPVVWLALLIAPSVKGGLPEILPSLLTAFNEPFHIELCEDSLKTVLVLLLCYAMGIGIYFSTQKNYRRREEHGSAKWGNARAVNKKYRQSPASANKLMTQNVCIGLNAKKHRRNLNTLVCGGSGAGKTRFYCKPNLMQCNTSFVILDPKGEILRDTGKLLESKGYEVRVLDLISMEKSHCYNPFVYLQNDNDVQKLVTNLFKSTTPKGSQSQDPFWDTSASMLLLALVFYLHYEAPEDEQNFAMIMEMLRAGAIEDEEDTRPSPLDELFAELEMSNPDHIALKYYRSYHSGAAKTLKSIIDRCTASVYRDYQQRGYTGTVPTLQDFRAELLKQDEPEAKEIALAIELFTHGSLNTFAKPTNVDTDNRLICYDILDLGKQLMPIGMLVVLDSILNRITQNRAKGKQTFIFIDEIYLLFQHEYSANFLFTLWKRVRKYGAYATGITQNVDDLLQSHTARTMLANSEFLIMLNQASTDRIELAKLLNISDLQLSYITNVDAGHGLIKVGSSLVPFANKFPKNTKLYKLMTTKPGEGA